MIAIPHLFQSHLEVEHVLEVLPDVSARAGEELHVLLWSAIPRLLLLQSRQILHALKTVWVMYRVDGVDVAQETERN